MDLPTHAEKEQVIKEYARIFGCGIFIETGTYFCEMVLAVQYHFEKIISIELSNVLAERARRIFSQFGHITIIHGDSGDILKDVLADIDSPCLFWLDGHYSGGCTARGKKDTPIMEELGHISDHSLRSFQDHVILIDDARCFNGENDYPKLNELKDFILKWHPDWKFKTENDIIRIHRGGLILKL